MAWLHLKPFSFHAYYYYSIPRFYRRTQEDFAQGEMVEVRGWLLARREAQVCAFLYLVG